MTSMGRLVGVVSLKEVCAVGFFFPNMVIYPLTFPPPFPPSSLAVPLAA